MKELTKALSAILILTFPIVSQESVSAHKPAQSGILGYLDPKTGAFRPVAQTPSEDSEINAASVVASTGKLVFNITINVASAIPASQTISCSASALTIETNLKTFQSGSFTEEASVVASRKGSTATCGVTIPYSWALSTPSSDTVDLDFSITSVAANGVVLSRYSSHSLAAIKVPVNGATTTETVSATI